VDILPKLAQISVISTLWLVFHSISRYNSPPFLATAKSVGFSAAFSRQTTTSGYFAYTPSLTEQQ
jgi:hypothetical protein